MTETRKRKAESVEELDAEIAEMETELAEGYGRSLTWDEVTSTTAAELARKEQRRGILPRLLHAAKVKRKEVELRGREREAEEVRAKLQPAYDAFQEKEAELRAAKEARDEAHGEWTLALSAVQSADERAKRVRRELREIRGDA